MKNLRFVFPLFLILALAVPHESTAVPAQDSLALIDLYNSTDGPNWRHNDNWLSDKVHRWRFVRTTGYRVTGLELSGNLLSGTIPASIGELTALENLDLSWNDISGSIPEEIGSLVNLVELNLEYNEQLTGSIPGTIGNLTELEIMKCRNDSLTGSIPAAIGALSKLQILDLHFNQVSGSLPSTIGGLTALTFLDLSGNQLTGSIPPEIGALTSLTQAWLGGNQLSGSIPEQIGELTSLTHLYLSGNQLEGEIPSQIGGLSDLEILYLNDNQLTGSIPEEIGGMTSLEWLFLNDNALSGTLPAAIGGLTGLNILLLNDNQLSGAVPDEITQLTQLHDLWLQNNRLEGLPDLHPLTAMNDLRVEYNRLTFEDLEPNVGVSSWMFSYSPQDSIGTRRDTMVAVGDPASLTVSAGGTQTNYWWKKNGEYIPGATDSILVIDPVTAADSGRYVCRATNNMATELALYSQPILLMVPHISNPAAGELWIAGETDTIRWSVPGQNVTITLSLDGGQTFTDTIKTSLANSGKCAWAVPDTIVSRKCVLRVESDGKPGAVVTSEEFKIKYYLLTRLAPDGQYEPFILDEDGWSFANVDTTMWPESWWGGDPPRFDYVNGIDPFTNVGYPKPLFHVGSAPPGPERFPDWPRFVSAYGTDQCFWSHFWGIYNLTTVEYWKSQLEEWGGSCFGLAVSCFMAFDDTARFREAFPVGDFQNLYDLAINDERRQTINLLQIRQRNKLYFKYLRQNYDNTPKETVNQIKQMLLNEVREDRTLTLFHRYKSERHAVCPLAVVESSPPYSVTVWIYDPNDPNNYHLIYVDTVNGKWYYDGQPDYRRVDNRGLILRDPANNYYNEATLPKSVVAKGHQVVADADTGEAYIEFFNTPSAFITIYDQSGDSIGFADSVAFEEIGGAIPIIPETGSYHPPIGYYLPRGDYSVRMRQFDEPYAYFRAFGDSAVFVYERADAAAGQSDRLTYGDGFGLSNPDGMSKSINVETIVVGESDERVFDVMNADVAQDDSLHLDVIDRRDLKMANVGTAKSYDLRVRRASETEYSVFEHTDIALGSNSSHLICPDWEDLPGQPVIIYIDEGDDGNIEDSLIVDNEYTEVEEQGSLGLPAKYALSQNYPNPFNAGTVLNYSLPRSSQVTLAVYNILGQRVVTLVDGMRRAGRYNIRWDAAGLSSGIYFARLETGEYSRTVKMMLLR